MKRSKPECAFHGDPTASDEFWKDFFRVCPLGNNDFSEACSKLATICQKMHLEIS